MNDFQLDPKSFWIRHTTLLVLLTPLYGPFHELCNFGDLPLRCIKLYIQTTSPSLNLSNILSDCRYIGIVLVSKQCVYFLYSNVLFWLECSSNGTPNLLIHSIIINASATVTAVWFWMVKTCDHHHLQISRVIPAIHRCINRLRMAHQNGCVKGEFLAPNHEKKFLNLDIISAIRCVINLPWRSFENPRTTTEIVNTKAKTTRWPVSHCGWLTELASPPMQNCGFRHLLIKLSLLQYLVTVLTAVVQFVDTTLVQILPSFLPLYSSYILFSKV